MKCRHGKSISKCDPCLSKIIKYIIRKDKDSCDCYANAFISLPVSTENVVRTFKEDEIFFDGTSNTQDCVTIPLTTVCSGSSLQVGNCKSPVDNWCKVIDQANGYITSLQVPKDCCGCYNFDLSASVALTGQMNVGVAIVGADVINASIFVNIPVRATLKLSEQLPREVCVADEVADTPETCFTSVTFPIIDTASATENISTKSLLNPLQVIPFIVSTELTATLLDQQEHFTNLSVSGTVCLKSCQRLVPTLTISKLENPSSFISIFNALQNPLVSMNFTNIKLLLSDLSLKLVKLGVCKDDCSCKQKTQN